MKSWEIACHTSSPEGTAEYYLRPHRYWVSVVPSGLDHVLKPTQDFILGYSQPSLRDSRGVFPHPLFVTNRAGSGGHNTYSDAGAAEKLCRWTLASTSGTVPSLTATSDSWP